LGTLLDNGVPLVHAVTVVAEIMGNAVLKQEIEKLREEIVEGSSLARGITKSQYFPLFVTNMVAVGEESGGLESALFKVADAYEREVERAVHVMTSMLEPIMILVMASVVGFIVVAMLLPIFQISIMSR
jgi:type II secretory pathway component PulF